MKINDKILSIPPYISTSWNYVKSIQMKGPFLVITLADGESINIPNLKNEVIETIFNTHASYMENNEPLSKHELFSSNSLHPESSDMSFKFGIASVDGFNNPLVHNPEQKNAPEIPKPVLEKIAAIAKIVSPEDLALLPKAEHECNCLHCQIVRTFQLPNEEKQFLEFIEETVTEEDLNFQEWDVAQTGDKLFNVSSRLDSQEKYSVYLGHPIGCTCGQNNCEHIVAVLKS